MINEMVKDSVYEVEHLEMRFSPRNHPGNERALREVR